MGVCVVRAVCVGRCMFSEGYVGVGVVRAVWAVCSECCMWV